MKTKPVRRSTARRLQRQTPLDSLGTASSAAFVVVVGAKGTREVPEIIRQFITSPKKYYRRHRVLAGLKPKLNRIIEEQSGTGQIENLCRHEMDWHKRGTVRSSALRPL